MKQKNKKNRPSKYLTIMSVVLSILCICLMAFDVVQCRETNLAEICSDKESYLQAMAYNSSGQTEDIITYIEEEYPTSASDYCFVAKDGELVFLRDKNMTKNLKETDVEAYFGISSRTPKIDGCNNAITVQLNGASWNVIRHDVETGEGTLTIGICINKDYMIAAGDFDILLTHSLLYMTLFSVAFIVSVVFLSHREKENEAMENKLTEQLVENRRLIERLGERLEAQSEVDYQRENGFCTKEVVAKVMGRLTPEQKSKCYKVRISLDKTDPQTIMRYSVLLERMKINKSVCCLWKDTEFLVLLLNIDEAGANHFVKQFLLQYQNMFQSDASDINISLEKFYSGEYR